MTSDSIEDLEKVLKFLRDNFPNTFHPQEISIRIGLPLEAVKGICHEAELNLWVDVVDRTPSGSFIKINYKGNEKLNRLTGNANALPIQGNITNINISGENVNVGSHNTNTTGRMPTQSSINWTKLGTIITGVGVVVTIIIALLLNSSPSTDNPSDSDSEFTILNQELINCDLLPDGQSGFNYVNKTLGYMVSWPNQDWIFTEDLKSHRANYGLESGESYLGGISVARESGFLVQFAVFDESDPIKTDFDEWIQLQEEGYALKLNDMKNSSYVSPEKNSARLDVAGVINGNNFSMNERLLKYDNKIFLIQKHQMSPEKYPDKWIQEINEVRDSFKLLSNCS